MAEEEDRSFAPNTVASDRAQMQGPGAEPSTDADRAPGADVAGREPDRSRSGASGALDENRPPSVALGQDDNPQEDWGAEAAPDAVFSANHTRRPLRTEAERGQGAKTRRMNKDIVSRRTP